jgi:hypothetical protein
MLSTNAALTFVAAAAQSEEVQNPKLWRLSIKDSRSTTIEY